MLFDVQKKRINVGNKLYKVKLQKISILTENLLQHTTTKETHEFTTS